MFIISSLPKLYLHILDVIKYCFGVFYRVLEKCGNKYHINLLLLKRSSPMHAGSVMFTVQLLRGDQVVGERHGITAVYTSLRTISPLKREAIPSWVRSAQ